MTVSNLLIYIIKSAISNQEIKINQAEVDWEALYQLADYHSVANYLVYAMDADTPSVYREKAQKAYSLSMVRSAKYDAENAMISLTVDASSSGNIKPALVMKALYDINNSELDEFGLLITREETYMNVGDEENRILKSLGYIGE